MPVTAYNLAEPDLLRLEHVTQTFGTNHALVDLVVCFPQGGTFGVVGPDAAGKTTLMRLLAGLIVPSSGELLVLGKRPWQDNTDIGYMPQRFGLYEDLSVRDNMRFHAQLRGVQGEARERSFAHLLEFTGLKPFQDRLAGALSGGMKQKLGIACALMGTPRLLLLDEPSVGVDPLSRRELWEMVHKLCATGMSVVWATSYLDEAQRCAQILMLDKGKLLYTGSPLDILNTMQGRVFTVPPQKDARAKLELWGMQTEICDAKMQGSHIRLVLHKNVDASRFPGLVPASPVLEDAYMDAVGGIGHSPSPFYFPDTPVSPVPSAPVIQALGLSKKFGTFVAADSITFTVQPGQIFGLLGPNGAGKSTIFRMLCGLLRPSSGQCFVAGTDMLRAGSTARAKLGYMAQKFSLYRELTVRANIDFFADLYGLDRKKRAQRTKILLEALGLNEYATQQTGSLPLGHKQRLSLLCAVLHEPPVLFLDEPTSGVDARARREFWKHILALTSQGIAVLVTTHFMEEAEYCDHIALINGGKMIESGTPEALKAACTSKGPNPTLEDAFIARIEQMRAEQSKSSPL